MVKCTFFHFFVDYAKKNIKLQAVVIIMGNQTLSSS